MSFVNPSTKLYNNTVVPHGAAMDEHFVGEPIPYLPPPPSFETYPAWQELLYARKLADFGRIWDNIHATHPLQKVDILLPGTVLVPVAPTEAAHKTLKSNLVDGRGDLLFLYDGAMRMLDTQKDGFEKLKSDQMANIPTDNLPKAWLGGLLRQIFPSAIKLISEQHHYAVASRLDGNTLDRCEMPCQFQKQYGLPCAHTILGLLDHDQALTRDRAL
ncbi:hypothetical protein E4U58_002384 [Claviceps cyperi]|nr:hypothetical protein E4U58_002384 [Claviceps cyperi]